MVSAQRGNTMDLNQFAIAGVPIWAELEKIVGKNGQALRKYVEENGVSIAQIDKAFANMTGAGGQFFQMLQNQSSTTAAKWSNFMAGLEEVGLKLFSAFQPALNMILDIGMVALPVLEMALWAIITPIQTVYDFLVAHKDIAAVLGIALGGLALNYILISNASKIAQAWQAALNITQLAGALITGQLTLAQIGLNTAFLASPIGWIVAGVGILIFAFVKLSNSLGGVMDALKALWGEVKQIFSNIADLFKRIFAPIFETIEHVKKGEYGKAALSAAHALFNLTPAGIAVETARWTVDGGATKGVGDSIKAARAKAVDQEKKGAASPADNKAKLPFASVPAADSAAGSGGGSGKGSGGGNNVTIQIDNLVKEITIHVIDTNLSMQQMQKLVKEALLGAVNDVNPAIR